jgi:hypothetical protein
VGPDLINDEANQIPISGSSAKAQPSPSYVVAKRYNRSTAENRRSIS